MPLAFLPRLAKLLGRPNPIAGVIFSWASVRSAMIFEAHQFVPPMDQGCFRAKPRKEQSFFASRVPAANHNDLHVTVRLRHKLRLVVTPFPPNISDSPGIFRSLEVAAPSCNDYCFRLQLPVACIQNFDGLLKSALSTYAFSTLAPNLTACLRSWSIQVVSVDSLGKAGEVFSSEVGK